MIDGIIVFSLLALLCHLFGLSVFAASFALIAEYLIILFALLVVASFIYRIIVERRLTESV